MRGKLLVSRFWDRITAGRRLAVELAPVACRDDVVVLGLPRGGVPVACAVAESLNVELDVFLVRKLRVPSHEQLAMGAIASGGVFVRNEDVLEHLEVPERTIEAVAAEQARELERFGPPVP